MQPNNTPSGEQQTNHTNTSGGASVGGNVDTHEFVGRDKQTINNIIIVGRFLEFAQIEGLLPKLEHKQDFSSVVEAIESNLGSRLNDDLADAVAWTGEILGEFLNEWIAHVLSENLDKPVPLAGMIESLIYDIGDKLQNNGFWKEYHSPFATTALDQYNDIIEVEDQVLWLETTASLFNQYWRNGILRIGIVRNDTSNWGVDDWGPDNGRREYQLITEASDMKKDISYKRPAPNTFTPKQLRIIIAGIVLDLIRIKAENTISVQFLRALADMVKPDSSKS